MHGLLIIITVHDRSDFLTWPTVCPIIKIPHNFNDFCNQSPQAGVGWLRCYVEADIACPFASTAMKPTVTNWKSTQGINKVPLFAVSLSIKW